MRKIHSIRIAAAAVTSAPAPQGRGRARGGGDAAEAKGGKKALSEEQKERIKAKNRRCVNGCNAGRPAASCHALRALAACAQRTRHGRRPAPAF